MFSVSDVAPGDASRIAGAYRAVTFSAPHVDLCRSGLFVNGATASADGRLGRGAGVEAVSARAVGWRDPPTRGLWSPIAQQLDRHRAWRERVGERPAGWDLLFLDANVEAVSERGIVISTAEGVFEAVAPGDHEALVYRQNLRLLARVQGLEMRAIGRLRLERPRTLELLAVSAVAMELPDTWCGRVNLGLDRLLATHMPRGEDSPAAELQQRADPLEPLRRRIRRVVLGGRATLPSEAFREIESDTAELRRQMLPTAATVLSELASAANATERDFSGQRWRPSDAIATAWLRAAVYERATTAELARCSWEAS
jgi:hypothetical protein